MEKTISRQLEEICCDWCKNYCKHVAYIDSLTGDEQDKAINELCTNCPINKIF